MESGEVLCAMTSGTTAMPPWSADSWDMPAKVSSYHTVQMQVVYHTISLNSINAPTCEFSPCELLTCHRSFGDSWSILWFGNRAHQSDLRPMHRQ